MKTMLEKWLLFFGVLFFCLFVIPELKASAAETYVYNISLNNIKSLSSASFYDYSLHDFELHHEINGLTHHFSSESWNIDIVLDPDDELYVFTFHVDWNHTLVKRPKLGVFFLVGNNGKVINDNVYTFSYTPSDYTLYTGGSLSSYGPNKEAFGLYYSNSLTGVVLHFDDNFILESNDNNQLSYVSQNFLYSTEDIYLADSDTLVFQRPLPTPTPTPSLQQQFQTAVMETNLEAVMNQAVGLVPLLIGFLITLISFSKGLRLLSQILRRV